MYTSIITSFCLFILIQNVLLANGHDRKGNKLMLFLMDGFRWDYVDQEGLDLPGFRKLIQEGVRAEYMIPAFPSLSYPNYYSIMTGLYVEDHGVVGNYMYDKKRKKKFLVGLNKEQYHSYWWDDGEPLWVTAEKMDRKVYMYHWPGCEVTIRGVNPTYCKKYNIFVTPHVKQMRASIKEGLKVFQNGSADVVGIYLETLDKYGHQYGVKSDKLNHALQEVDKEIGSLLDQLKSLNLQDEVNVMIFADHGMTNLSESRVISITNHINMDDIDVIMDFGPTVNIWPKDGKIKKVYRDLKKINNKNLQIFKKKDIPKRWHFGKHSRVPPIFLVATNGWYITTPQMKTLFKYFDSGTIRGSHGYDNREPDMRSVFMATGPDFKKNVITQPFVDVHLYQVMCEALGIHAAPNNGSWQVAKEMLAPRSSYIQSYFHDDVTVDYKTKDRNRKLKAKTRNSNAKGGSQTKGDNTASKASQLTFDLLLNLLPFLSYVCFMSSKRIQILLKLF